MDERANKKRHVNRTDTKAAFPRAEDTHPQKRKAQVFGTFSQKVHTHPEIERGATGVVESDGASENYPEVELGIVI